ncbi:MAG TPA: SRPBCC domain-containing protein [Candidatus Eremiobacteraceae bacterium]|nr:SRPBCC domain-containing protein [Candidatus Eremiobacteraceae bacterium]
MAVPNSSIEEVVVERTFDASRERVFKAWTDPKLVQRWWGPHDFTNPVCEIDARPGGAIRVHMQGPDGTIYPMTGIYKEVVEPERIVFTTTPLDDKGKPLFEVLTTVTFVERAGKTHVSVHNRVLSATAGADMYLQGMEAGWSQSLDRLGEVVT